MKLSRSIYRPYEAEAQEVIRAARPLLSPLRSAANAKAVQLDVIDVPAQAFHHAFDPDRNRRSEMTHVSIRFFFFLMELP